MKITLDKATPEQLIKELARRNNIKIEDTEVKTAKQTKAQILASAQQEALDKLYDNGTLISLNDEYHNIKLPNLKLNYKDIFSVTFSFYIGSDRPEVDYNNSETVSFKDKGLDNLLSLSEYNHFDNLVNIFQSNSGPKDLQKQYNEHFKTMNAIIETFKNKVLKIAKDAGANQEDLLDEVMNY